MRAHDVTSSSAVSTTSWGEPAVDDSISSSIGFIVGSRSPKGSSTTRGSVSSPPVSARTASMRFTSAWASSAVT